MLKRIKHFIVKCHDGSVTQKQIKVLRWSVYYIHDGGRPLYDIIAEVNGVKQRITEHDGETLDNEYNSDILFFYYWRKMKVYLNIRRRLVQSMPNKDR